MCCKILPICPLLALSTRFPIVETMSRSYDVCACVCRPAGGRLRAIAPPDVKTKQVASVPSIVNSWNGRTDGRTDGRTELNLTLLIVVLWSLAWSTRKELFRINKDFT